MADVSLTAGLAKDQTLQEISDQLPAMLSSDGKLKVDVDVSNLATEETLDEVNAKLPPLTPDGKLAVAVDTSALATESTLGKVNTSLGDDGGTAPANGTGVRGWLRQISDKLTSGIDINDRASRLLGKVTSDQLPSALDGDRLKVALPAGGGSLTNTELRATPVPVGTGRYASGTFTTVGDIVTLDNQVGSQMVTVTVVAPSDGATTYAGGQVFLSWDGVTWIPAPQIAMPYVPQQFLNTNSNVGSSMTFRTGGGSGPVVWPFTVTTYGARYIRARYTSAASGVTFNCYIAATDASLREITLRGFQNAQSELSTVAGTVNVQIPSGSSGLAVQPGSNAIFTIGAQVVRSQKRSGTLAANTAVALSGTAMGNLTNGYALYIAEFYSDQPLVVSVQQGTGAASNGTWRPVAAPITLTGKAYSSTDPDSGYSAQLMFYAAGDYMRAYVEASTTAATIMEITETLVRR